MMATIAFVLFAYLIGSISFAVIASKLFGLPDPRTFGSKNPGATNVLRTGKKAAAALTLFGDGAKGWLAVFLALHFAADYGVGEYGIAAVCVAVFLGHVYPVFFNFHGGKGVATLLGILLALSLWLGLSVLATWLVAILIWRISSLSALIAAALAPIMQCCCCALIFFPRRCFYYRCCLFGDIKAIYVISSPAKKSPSDRLTGLRICRRNDPRFLRY